MRGSPMFLARSFVDIANVIAGIHTGDALEKSLWQPGISSYRVNMRPCSFLIRKRPCHFNPRFDISESTWDDLTVVHLIRRHCSDVESNHMASSVIFMPT